MLMPEHKKYYLEDLGTHDSYHVWLVNGEKIRKELNENFVEYDSHYHLPFIPKDEFWIDSETVPSERKYFIEHLLKETEYIESGLSPDEATRKADLFEKKERMHSKRVRRILDTLSHKELVEKIHKEKLKKATSHRRFCYSYQRQRKRSKELFSSVHGSVNGLRAGPARFRD